MLKRSVKLVSAIICLLIFPVLFIYADSTPMLSANGDAPAAWLSAKPGSATFTHDLRVIIATPATTDPSSVTVTLSFDGEAAPKTVSYTLSGLTLYKTVKAGKTTYKVDEDSSVRILTVKALADGSYTTLSLRLEQNGKTIYQSTQTAANLETVADLKLTPWDGSLTDWMAALPDSRSLAEITIPGTHDSGATVNLLGGLFVQSKCQNLSIADQLNSGVRFLDIRLKLESGKLNVYHGIVSQNLNLDQVLSDCKAFLAAHPGETILLSIRDEAESDSADFANAIATAINQDSSMWYITNRMPKLGEARGKIVLLRRYPHASIGYNCWDGWSSDIFTTNTGSRVQDFFKVGSNNNTNLENKWNKIVSMANEAAQTDKTFCINFTSGYTGTANITSVSNYINPKLTEYFKTLPQGGYGTYPIDFITPEIASALIATNFPG